MKAHEKFMRRCFELAGKGAQNARPNPMVGSVLVHEGRILGEGYHQQYGKAHAEVNAVNHVAPSDQSLIEHATMYISLEPCCHYGKTPPCTSMIIAQRIPRVVISTPDPNPLVSGKGIEILRKAGVEVTSGILEEGGRHLIRAFRCYVLKKRPYVILKMALSKDGFIGYDDKQIWMTNAYADISSHKLRSEIDAILVGTNTAVTDNPSLNTRLYFGSSPLRVIIDRSLRVPVNSNIYDQSLPTLIYSEKETGNDARNINFRSLPFDETLCRNILTDLHTRGVQKLLVEGGAKTIQGFLDASLWDETWLYNTPVRLSKGIRAPVIKGRLMESYNLAGNQLQIIAAQ